MPRGLHTVQTVAEIGNGQPSCFCVQTICNLKLTQWAPDSVVLWRKAQHWQLKTACHSWSMYSPKWRLCTNDNAASLSHFDKAVVHPPTEREPVSPIKMYDNVHTLNPRRFSTIRDICCCCVSISATTQETGKQKKTGRRRTHGCSSYIRADKSSP